MQPSVISSTTTGLSKVPNSIIAKGNGIYQNNIGGATYENIKLGFVYSTSTMTVVSGITVGDLVNQSIVPSGGQIVSSVEKTNTYPGGANPWPTRTIDINVDYILKLTNIVANTTYYVRSYTSFYYGGDGPYYRYGSEISIISPDVLPGGHGYYVSNDTVGFYDPLQIRDAEEGVESVLTSDSSGLTKWKPVKSLFTFGHYIGEKYGGGVVAGVWKEGDDEKVLIVSNEDITTEEGSGVIGPSGVITNIPYKMGNANALDNPGTSNATSKYFTFHNLAGTGPYAGGNPQNIAIMCIHNLDMNSIDESNFFLSFSGTGFNINPTESAGGGVFTNIPGGYNYSKTITKGLLKITSTTTSVVNVFRVVGAGYYYTGMTTDARFLASDYRILYNPGGGTIGVFRIYVDYLGSETVVSTSGGGQNFPATDEVVKIYYDPTGTGLNYQPLPYISDVRWSVGAASSTTIGTSSQSLYNGYLNTSAIIAQSNTLGTTYSAAKICTDYRGSGYDDWYLPSYYELNQVFNQSAIINKVLGNESLRFLDKNYWTSTEYFFPPGVGQANSANSAIIFNSSLGGDYTVGNKGATARVRAVRKESVYTGDGLILNLDVTNKKSFSDMDYLNLGTASKWKDLVNGGLTSSYSFNFSSYPSTSSGGTLQNLIQELLTVNTDSLAYRKVGNWWIDKITGTSVPTLYNNTGTSSLTSDYFSVTVPDAYLQFDTLDQSTVKASSKATINIYVSVRSNGYDSPYTLIKQVINTVGNNNVSPTPVVVPLYSYQGKTISIRMTAPNAYYTGSTDNGGPSIDNLYVRGYIGGYRATGPVYFPDESGFLRFNGTGSMSDELNSFGSYLDINAPIGSSGTVTVEIWMRMREGYQTRMPFGWSRYCIFTGAGGGLGFNTGNGDLFGIDSTKVQSLRIVGNWAHCVFEMKSGTYANNKIYINGNEQVLSQVTGLEDTTYTNFNNGQCRVGGWRNITNNKLYLFRGDISVVRIYNRALTKDEIMKNYSTEKKRYEILPTILTNNLSFNIDFDNPLSYSGDGTTSGVVNDLTGSGRTANLTISGTTIKPAVIKTSTLYNGKELIFPGTIFLNPYLSIPTSTPIQNMTNLSVSFWVKVQQYRLAEIIVKWDQNGNNIGQWEVFQSQSKIAFRIRDNSLGVNTQTRVGTKTLAIDKWTHVCATYDSSSKKMKTYIDGILDIDSFTPNSFSMSTVSGDMFVGQYPNTTIGERYPLFGSIAEIQIYNKALSYGEVKNNYEADKFRFDNFSDANKFISHEINGNPTFSISQNLSLDLENLTNEKILKITESGYSKWVDKTSLFTRPTNYRYIGELYGGGIIVAMWNYPKTIFNYLIMSLEDVSTGSIWSNITSGLVGASSDFKGNENQTNILLQSGHTTSAAKLCDNYTAGGFTDWYLPSVFEMNQAFNAGSIVDTVLGSDSLSGLYWTSTEIDSNNAYYYSTMEVLVPSIGYQKSALKSTTRKVRAFRLATNAVQVRPWRPWWDDEVYTPWYEPTYIDWQPAIYDTATFDYWGRTRVVTGSFAQTNTYIFKVTGSTITTWDPILEFGVCWTGASGGFNTSTPTILDNKVVGSGSYDIYNSEITFLYAPSIFYMITVRAYVTTTSGTYYGSEITLTNNN